jgi:hypothetical protein
MTKSAGTSPLTLIHPAPIGISPPRALGAHGTALWNRVQAEYRIEDIGGIELLTQACQALDRAEALAAAIARDGEVIHTRTGVPKTHPAVKDELACRAFVVRTIERLGLNVEAIKPTIGKSRPCGADLRR